MSKTTCAWCDEDAIVRMQHKKLKKIFSLCDDCTDLLDPNWEVMGSCYTHYSAMINLVDIINKRAKLALDDNGVLLKADKAVQNVYGYSPLLITETQLCPVVQEVYVTAAELGREMEDKPPAVAVNKKLAEAGLQVEVRDSKGKLVWELTDAGKEFGRYLDVGKNHRNGTPVLQMKWLKKTTTQIS